MLHFMLNSMLNPCSTPCSTYCSNPCSTSYSTQCSNPCSTPCSNYCSTPCSTSMVAKLKMNKTAVIRRDYLHYVKKYNRQVIDRTSLNIIQHGYRGRFASSGLTAR